MAAYVVAPRPGKELLEASNMFAQWMLEVQRQQTATQLAQSQLQTEQLRRQALQQNTEINQAQFDEWTNTAGLRREALQADTAQKKQSVLSEQSKTAYYDVNRQLAEQDLKYKPLQYADEHDKQVAAIAAYQAQQKSMGVHDRIAELKWKMEGPMMKAQTDMAQQQIINLKEAEQQMRQQMISGQQDQEWQYIGKAISTMMQFNNEADRAKLRENVSSLDPGVGKYLNMIPLGVSSPGKAWERIVDNLEARARKGDGEAQDALSKIGALHLTGGQIPKKTVDIKIGNTVMGTREVEDWESITEPLKKAFQAGYGAAKPNEPTNAQQSIINQRVSEATGNVGVSSGKVSENTLPIGLREKWKYLESKPNFANRNFFANMKNEDVPFRKFVDEIPRGKVVETAGGKKLRTEQDRYYPDDAMYNQDVFAILEKGSPPPSSKLTRALGTSTGEGGYYARPLLDKEFDRNAFRQTFVWDREATTRQHVMYLSLMRELAKARNIGNDRTASSIKNQFLRAVGPDFLTKNQMASLSQLEQIYGWE